MAYMVEQVEHGIVVRGAIPVTDMVALTKAWSKQGYDKLMTGVATALNATLAVCREDQAEAWLKEIDSRAQKVAGDDVELAWLNGSDTGTSSKTIFSVLSAKHGAYALLRHGAGVPYDPDDFGRCYRLLALIPEWRERMSDVAAKYPMWVALVREWDRLTELYDKKEWRKLYDAMQPLIDEGRIADGWVQTGKGSWSKVKS